MYPNLTTLANAAEWLGLSNIPITGVALANPCVITVRNASGISDGMWVSLSDIGGTVELNDRTLPATVIDATHFSIPVDATGFTAYTSGGFVNVSSRLLSRLIAAGSQYVQNAIQRQIPSQAYTETRNGQGGPVLLFLNAPCTEVLQLLVEGQVVLPRPALASSVTSSGYGGYVFDELKLMLPGGVFPRGFQNVQISYLAGYRVEDEVQVIPAAAPYTLTTQAQWSAGDRGVIYRNGSPLTLVTGTPELGQYAVDGSTYTFAAADAGATVALSYAVVPQDIEQAVIDLIGDWFRYRSRIGKLSESIETQQITFVNAAIPARANGVLNQYRRVAPIQ